MSGDYLLSIMRLAEYVEGADATLMFQHAESMLAYRTETGGDATVPASLGAARRAALAAWADDLERHQKARDAGDCGGRTQRGRPCRRGKSCTSPHRRPR